MRNGAALVGLLAIGCEPPNSEPQPFVAGPPIECVATSPVEAEFRVANPPATVRVSGTEQPEDGHLRVDFDDGLFLDLLLVPNELPVDFPAGMELTVDAQEADCFGEGCDWTAYELLSSDLAPLLLFGELQFLDDAVRSSQTFNVGEVEFARTDADVSCPTGSGAALGVLSIASDDGALELLPSETGTLRIGGARWAARAGRSLRTEFAQNGTDCEDCPEPGVHSITSLEMLLYRVADE